MTAREELDLLCKWLGPKSSEHAKSIRAVHIHDAAAGVRMVWERLEDCYGSPEAIENALLKKLEDFPKIANRENHRLRELGDILLELEAAKVDGFLPGLNCLDTSRGIIPIVQKLLHARQVGLFSIPVQRKPPDDLSAFLLLRKVCLRSSQNNQRSKLCHTDRWLGLGKDRTSHKTQHKMACLCQENTGFSRT